MKNGGLNMPTKAQIENRRKLRQFKKKYKISLEMLMLIFLIIFLGMTVYINIELGNF